MSVSRKAQARRSRSHREWGVGLNATHPRSKEIDLDEPTFDGEMTVREWRDWRQRIRRLLSRPLSLTERGFLEGQLYRLGQHPWEAMEAEPPCAYALEWIKELERGHQQKTERGRAG